MHSPNDKLLIDQAKARLQAVLGWDEPTAYRAIRRVSQDRRQPMATVAEYVLRNWDSLLDVVRSYRASQRTSQRHSCIRRG